MSLEVQFTEENTHLSVKAAGQYRLADLSDLLDRARDEAEKRGLEKVLLDISEVAGSVPLLDMLVLGEHCARTWKRWTKVAVVSREGGIDRFFENVVCNRGLCLAVVLNHVAASEWLIHHGCPD